MSRDAPAVHEPMTGADEHGADGIERSVERRKQRVGIRREDRAYESHAKQAEFSAG